jgi:hypothetical protein
MSTTVKAIARAAGNAVRARLEIEAKRSPIRIFQTDAIFFDPVQSRVLTAIFLTITPSRV